MSAASPEVGPPGASGPRLGRADRATLARAVAEAVTAVPGVASLSAGGGGVEVGTQYPGGTVVGVAIRSEAVVVHVVVDYLPLTELIETARSAAVAALRQLGDPRVVEMVVEDIVAEEPRSGWDR